MKIIFSEYGRFVIAIIAALGIFAMIFGGIKLFDNIGTSIDVKPTFYHSDSENSFKAEVKRNKPTFTLVNDDNLRIYENKVFKPKSLVKCIDNEGNQINDYQVSKITYVDKSNNKYDFTKHYNDDNDLIVINEMYYFSDDEKCNPDDFTNDIIPDESYYNQKGSLSVTYTAIDSKGLKTTKTFTFIIEGGTKN